MRLLIKNIIELFHIADLIIKLYFFHRSYFPLVDWSCSTCINGVSSNPVGFLHK